MKTPPPKLNRQILDEASEWFVDFRVGDVDERASEQFDEWLRRSPEHIRAYMEIAKTYVALPSLTPNRKIDVQELIAYARSEGNVLPFGHLGGVAQKPDATRAVSTIRSRRFSVFARPIAASVAIISLVGGFLAWSVTHMAPTYSTDVGERRSITLPDGSTVELNAVSKIRVRLSAKERDIDLAAGQALFEVAKDASRPFVVHSGSTLVRAVGTQFDVYRKATGTTVTVVEGRVTVVNQDSLTTPASESQRASVVATPAETFVSAGEQVTVANGTLRAPKRANISAVTGWLQHHLIFDGTRLHDVAEDFNRYNTRKIAIEDPDLEDFHVSGVYSSTDPASLIRFLREQPGVRVIETDEGVRVTRQ